MRRKWLWMVWAGLAVGPLRSGAEVALELRIPPAETYVLGDTIPLLWRFNNQSAQALGFLWEGCCRLNGRLEVRAADRALGTVPPGQALAHMFARADRLEPGAPKDYETKVADWVALPGTGTYELRGTYRGVLPSQSPQVPRGLALWRESAVSAPVRLDVLAVGDYLATRGPRQQRRGLRVELSAPANLVPLEPATFRIAIENLTAETQRVTWPDELGLWVLDGADHRVAPAVVVGGSTSVEEVPARGRWEREFSVPADRFEAEPFGDYRIFVDLAEAGRERPRVPSNVRALAWRPDVRQLGRLVALAAQGPATGARNAPLKFLRLHLGEVTETLAGLDPASFSETGRVLLDRLVLAGRLRPLAPRPGAVEVAVGVAADGGARWENALVASQLGARGEDLPSQARELLAVRRHLGLELELRLAPERAARMGTVFRWGREMVGPSTEWNGRPLLVSPVVATNVVVHLDLHGEPAPGRGVLRVTANGREWAANGGDWVRVEGGTMVTAAAALARTGNGFRVLADASVSWGEVAEAMSPLIAAGMTVDVGETGVSPR